VTISSSAYINKKNIYLSTYGVENTGPGLGQHLICGGIKSVNEISPTTKTDTNKNKTKNSSIYDAYLKYISSIVLHREYFLANIHGK
jgi:hypothetical protein